MRTPLATLIPLALFLPVAFGQKDPPPKKDAKPAAVPVATSKEAAEILKQHRKLYGKKSPLAKRLAGVELLATKQNEKFVSVLAKILNGDRSEIVRAEAAKALSRQNFPKAQKTLMSALAACSKGKDARAQVVGLAILEGIHELGYFPSYYNTLCDLFKRERTEAKIQQLVVRIFDKAEEKRAFRLLVDNLDEPAPENVDDPSNPPASYWEQRWKKWDVWRLDIAKALKTLTGVEFKEAKFYREWARKEGRKKGIKY